MLEKLVVMEDFCVCLVLGLELVGQGSDVSLQNLFLTFKGTRFD